MPCGPGGIVPVIIDTTVWIDFFRNAKTEQTELLEVVVRRGDAALGDLIVSEVLQGVDTDKEFRSLKRHFSNFRVYPMIGRQNAIQSAVNYRKLRGKGFHGSQDRGLLDRDVLYRTRFSSPSQRSRFRSIRATPRLESDTLTSIRGEDWAVMRETVRSQEVRIPEAGCQPLDHCAAKGRDAGTTVN